MKEKKIYDFTVSDMSKKPVDLSIYSGKVILEIGRASCRERV